MVKRREGEGSGVPPGVAQGDPGVEVRGGDTALAAGFIIGENRDLGDLAPSAGGSSHQGKGEGRGLVSAVDIPWAQLRVGGVDSGAHTLNEFFETTDAHKGVQEAMLLALLLAGVEGETESILD